jgi:two-component system chemotaxis response regulator CheB
MTAARRIRILIADDSAVMRSLLRSVVGTDPGLEVAGTVADGAAALDAMASLRPDLVLLDVEMPVMDGLATLKAMRAGGHKMPIVMCSSLTQRGAKVTLDALAAGASDYVAKPAGQEDRVAAMRALAHDLIPMIHALASQPQLLAPGSPGIFQPPPMPVQRPQAAASAPTLLVIGVSTGGPAALDVLLSALPSSFPLPVLIVQHMPELFTGILAERLNGICPLHVRQAAEGDPVRTGIVYVARGDWHLEVLAAARPADPPTLHLTKGPLEHFCRPAVDVLFRSAAAVYGAGVLAVVLTGMGSDGAIGSRLIREHGGSVLAQDQATSTVWGMPGAVVQAGLAQRILPLNAIAPEILRIASRSLAGASEPRESAA